MRPPSVVAEKVRLAYGEMAQVNIARRDTPVEPIVRVRLTSIRPQRRDPLVEQDRFSQNQGKPRAFIARPTHN